MKSEVCNMASERQSAHYKPNIWKYDFLQSLTSKYYEEEEYYRSRAEKLKGDVKHLFVEAVEVLAKLELIDTIRKLGLSNLFEDEIREALDTIASMENIIENLCGAEEDLLYVTALYFRLLRQARL
ncbi:hypothetical protein Dsin_027739 [Dipteronia sinensis]|uniref:Terpene synthase N-terminal domain-containing protein n=1 Tax=Dipteronia sinensis TaxID=43782 RepID=A0AAD9ZPB3_9ROSI|nr:hypothetical protein Dsin_027739 [Dipteronia sinensis]